MADQLRKYNRDLNLTIRITLTDEDGNAFDLSTASSVYMYFYAPDGTTYSVAASIVNPPGTDGLIQYKHSSSDFELVNGVYSFTGSVVWNDGTENVGVNTGSFRVKGLFEE